MNHLQFDDVPELLKNEKFCPFNNIASPELQLSHERFDILQSSCGYFSFPVSIQRNKSSQHEFNIIHINAISICSNEKFEELQLFLYRSQCAWHAICITETWLSDYQIPYRQLPEYTGYFHNRDSKMGGGVAIYIHTHYVKHSKLSEIATLNCTQSIIIECQMFNSSPCILGAIYRPPYLNNEIFLSELETLPGNINTKTKTTFLVGDFNYDLFNIAEDKNSLDFFNTLACNGFWPTIFKTTRFSDDGKCSLLDSICSNNIEFISRSGLIYDDFSDHFPIFTCCTPHLGTPAVPDPTKYIFNESKITSFKEYLTDQLHNFSQLTDPNIASNILIEAYSSGIKLFSSKVKCTRKTKAIKPWISPGILTSINRRIFLYKKIKILHLKTNLLIITIETVSI